MKVTQTINRKFMLPMAFSFVSRKAEGEESQTIEGFVSMETSNRDYDVIPPEAFNIDLYMQNPQVWYNHRPWKDDNGNDVPCGKCLFLTVARLSALPDGSLAVIDKRDEKESVLGFITKEKAEILDIKENDVGLWAKIKITIDDIWESIKKGELNAFSWQGKVEIEEGLIERNGELVPCYIAKKIDLYEISVVLVPANEKAVFNVAKSLFPVEEIKEPVAEKTCTDKVSSQDTPIEDGKKYRVEFKKVEKTSKEEQTVEKLEIILDLIKDSKVTIESEDVYSKFLDSMTEEQFVEHRKALEALIKETDEYIISVKDVEGAEDVELHVEKKVAEVKKEAEVPAEEPKKADEPSEIDVLKAQIAELKAQLEKATQPEKIEPEKTETEEKTLTIDDVKTLLEEELRKVTSHEKASSTIELKGLESVVSKLADAAEKLSNVKIEAKGITEFETEEEVETLREDSLWDSIIPNELGNTHFIG